MKKNNLPFNIVSFYKFTPFTKPELKKIRNCLLETGKDKKIVGLILLSTEGINATISGFPTKIKEYIKELEEITGQKNFLYKHSPSSISAFKALRIKIKKEIITFQKPLKSAEFGFYNLEPEEWETILNEKEITVLDIRNDYEVELGQFKQAKTMNIKEFSEFSQKLNSLNLPKNQKTLLYCTGGVRCEKAIIEMKKQGFAELYQLKGGILNYLKQFPNKSFEGECFVFDHRAALDQNLKPSKKYQLCPHCGQAGGEIIECQHCEKKTKICKKCFYKKQKDLITCSKNCAYHFRMGHKCKKPHKSI